MTPLQQQLAARSVEGAELSGIGIDADRARQVLAGADPTIDEVRRIAARYAIPVRDLIAPVTTLRERSLKLRENIRELARRDGDREIGSILARAAVIADAVRRGPSERIQVALEVGSKTFDKAAAVADLCRFDLFGADDEEPFIDLERKVVLHAGAYVLVIQQRTVEGAALVLGEVPIL